MMNIEQFIVTSREDIAKFIADNPSHTADEFVKFVAKTIESKMGSAYARSDRALADLIVFAAESGVDISGASGMAKVTVAEATAFIRESGIGVFSKWLPLIAGLADDVVAIEASIKSTKSKQTQNALKQGTKGATIKVDLTMLGYGESVEFGTLRRPPAPFIRPVLQKNHTVIEVFGGVVKI